MIKSANSNGNLNMRQSPYNLILRNVGLWVIQCILFSVIILTCLNSELRAEKINLNLPAGKHTTVEAISINGNYYVSLQSFLKNIFPDSKYNSETNEMVYRDNLLRFQPGSFYIVHKFEDKESTYQMQIPLLMQSKSQLVPISNFIKILQQTNLVNINYKHPKIQVVSYPPVKKTIKNKTELVRKQQKIKEKKSTTKSLIDNDIVKEFLSTRTDTSNNEAQAISISKLSGNNKSKSNIKEKKEIKTQVIKNQPVKDNILTGNIQKISGIINKIVSNNMDINSETENNIKTQKSIEPTVLQLTPPMDTVITTHKSKSEYPPSYYVIPKDLKKGELK